MLRAVSTGLKALEKAIDPAEVLEIERKLESIEHAMRNTGLFKPEQVREANEGKIRARWKLGRLLAQIERAKHPGKGKVASASLTSLLKQIGLDRQTAMESQRIGAMPKPKLDKAFEPYRGTEDYITYRELIIYARPFWHQEKRKDNHARIVTQAAKAKAPDKLGPFALIYWDPPWTFETHTPEMTHRMPDDHYPTLTDQEIIDLKFHGQTIQQLAHKDCATFTWCTSSNLKRAIHVMESVGFEYRTHAIWDKEMIGLGLIFRNQHEVLLYGSRGNPPKPVELFSSVFRYPRGEHSAKPPEIRQMLERMYPHFTAENRVELFARGEIKGWTALGYEAAE
jgi:N6-adenosine-specific RNA methylase IME4